MNGLRCGFTSLRPAAECCSHQWFIASSLVLSVCSAPSSTITTTNRAFSIADTENLMPNNHYDVIIIGTGAGGGTLASKLAPTGKKILMLERGDYVPREKDNWSSAAVNLQAKY